MDGVITPGVKNKHVVGQINSFKWCFMDLVELKKQ